MTLRRAYDEIMEHDIPIFPLLQVTAQGGQQDALVVVAV